VANGKHRKTRIFRLDQDDGVIEGGGNLKKFITNYYKGLFGVPDGNHFFLVESTTHDISQVSQLKNEVSTADLLEKKLNRHFFFFKWSIIKHLDLMSSQPSSVKFLRINKRGSSTPF